MTPAWIETSSADTGSSRMISFGRSAMCASDADALALAAGETHGVAVAVLGVEPTTRIRSRTIVRLLESYRP